MIQQTPTADSSAPRPGAISGPLADRQTVTLDQRTRLIRQASLVALLGNAILAAGKITIGLLAGSMAVVGDGIDSTTDVAIAVMSLVIAGIIARPADHDHPWGHSRAETMGTTVLAFMLFFAGAQLVMGSVGDLLAGTRSSLPELPAIIITLVSMAGKAVLALVQYRLGKKAGSAMLEANGINMKNDVIMSSGVLAGLLVAVLAGIPAADSVTAALVGLWVIKSAVGIFREANLELMDGTDSQEHYRAVFEAALSVPGVKRPHRARMRRIASLWDIDLDIEVDGNLTVAQAHHLAVQVEQAIKARLVEVYDIMVHVEPDDHVEEHGEAFGLSPAHLPPATEPGQPDS